jgi:hypothetical protein
MGLEEMERHGKRHWRCFVVDTNIAIFSLFGRGRNWKWAFSVQIGVERCGLLKI